MCLSRTVLLVSLVMVIVSGLVFSSSAHGAAVTHSEVHIDWTSLRITTTSGMTIAWTNRFDNPLLGYPPGTTTRYVIPGFQDRVSAHQSIAAANGSAYGFTSTDAFGMHLFTGAETHGLGDVFGDATAYRGAEFRASGTGSINVAVDYVLKSDSATTPGSTVDHTSGMAWADLFLWTPSDSVLREILGTATGTLSVSMFLNDGDTGILRVGTYASSNATTLYGPAPIPEPATIVLLGAGLVGVALIGKKYIG